MKTPAMTYAQKMHKALVGMSDDQAKVLWLAIAAYVENGQCAPEEDVYVADPYLKPAEHLLAKMDVVVCVQTVDVGRDFSPCPGGRYDRDGPSSGAAFRRLLRSKLESGFVEVLLDGTLGYGSSFLEEAFGGLVSEDGFTPEAVRDSLALVSTDQSLVEEIWSYIAGKEIIPK